MMAVNNFIQHIISKEFPHTENIYSENFENSDITVYNLSLYLNKMLLLKPTCLIVGEAPGYKGCRWSGIPFVSEAIIVENAFFHSGDFKVRNDKSPQREGTATIVWNYLTEKKIYPLIWNAFPLHPYKNDNKNSNRKPNSDELIFGKELLTELMEIFNISPANIIAVGQSAGKILKKFGVTKVVRHPSHGGKTEFIIGMDKYL